MSSRALAARLGAAESRLGPPPPHPLRYPIVAVLPDGAEYIYRDDADPPIPCIQVAGRPRRPPWRRLRPGDLDHAIGVERHEADSLVALRVLWRPGAPRRSFVRAGRDRGHDRFPLALD